VPHLVSLSRLERRVRDFRSSHLRQLAVDRGAGGRRQLQGVEWRHDVRVERPNEHHAEDGDRQQPGDA